MRDVKLWCVITTRFRIFGSSKEKVKGWRVVMNILNNQI